MSGSGAVRKVVGRSIVGQIHRLPLTQGLLSPQGGPRLLSSVVSSLRRPVHMEMRACSCMSRGFSTKGRGGGIVDSKNATTMVRLVEKDPVTGKGVSTVMTTEQALRKAKETGLQLMLVSSSADPWVVRLADVRREEYERSKKLKTVKKTKNTGSIMKEITVKSNISDHDLGIKMRRAAEFLAEGYQLRVVITPVHTKGVDLPTRISQVHEQIFKVHLLNKINSVNELTAAVGQLKREFHMTGKRPGAAPEPASSPSSVGSVDTINHSTANQAAATTSPTIAAANGSAIRGLAPTTGGVNGEGRRAGVVNGGAQQQQQQHQRPKQQQQQPQLQQQRGRRVVDVMEGVQ